MREQPDWVGQPLPQDIRRAFPGQVGVTMGQGRTLYR